MDNYTLPGARSRYLQLFRKCGIAEERLSLSDEQVDDRGDHLARYGQIDIALDPFPYNGTTTTFEALGMGVPVVTLLGECMRARMSAAMLVKIGLPQLIARDEAEYVEIARQLASNPGELASLRAELRERVANSPLCAEQARTRQLERLYRRMWKIWTANQEHHA
jgi:predicted O-linked N-acetylglucosamine transferase (SPINDLY family)